MKKNILFVLCAIFITINVTSQTKEIRVMLGGGYSTNGSGSGHGYSFFNQVDIQLNKRFYISPGIQFTNHAQTYSLPPWNLNYVTGGVDVFTNINYLIISRSHHHFALGAGPFIRFQSSSVPLYACTTWDFNTNQKLLDIEYGKLRTTSVGFNVAPMYYYQCNNKLLFGAKFSFQNDTEGDVITAATVFVGVKL